MERFPRYKQYQDRHGKFVTVPLTELEKREFTQDFLRESGILWGVFKKLKYLVTKTPDCYTVGPQPRKLIQPCGMKRIAGVSVQRAFKHLMRRKKRNG